MYISSNENMIYIYIYILNLIYWVHSENSGVNNSQQIKPSLAKYILQV